MSCCGKGRLQARQARPESRPNPALRTIFEYRGATAMVVISPVTGRRYHFAARGARLETDARDRQYLMTIPHLLLRTS